MKHVVIVESPNKAGRIQKILRTMFSENDYAVVSTFGHFRDLPVDRIGISQKRFKFEPTWLLVKGTGRKAKTGILKEAKIADVVWVATDPDAEGEAIAWHVYDLLREAKIEAPIHRAHFHEITANALRKAFTNPGKLNTGRVEAAITRRMLDRLVGYQVSPKLASTLRCSKGLSAGRVQSVVLDWIMQREIDIRNFKPEKYFFLNCTLSDGRTVRGEQRYPRSKSAHIALQALLRAKPKSSDREFEVKPPPPFHTAALIRAASSILGYSAKDTMKMAQSLFEMGRISYHRTESPSMSWGYINRARKHLQGLLPKTKQDHLSPKGRNWPAKGGHEAIRPTDPTFLSGAITDRKKAALYRLIWLRSLVGQMRPAVIEARDFVFEGKLYGKKAEALLKVTYHRVKFEGWLAISNGVFDSYSKTRGDLPKKVAVKEGSVEFDFTKPPIPWTESSLVYEMEQKGIGRPSTYAQAIAKQFQRGYVRAAGKTIRCTPRGEVVGLTLRAGIPELVDDTFTAKMEHQLDLLASSKRRRFSMRGVVLFRYVKWLDRRLSSFSTSIEIPACPKDKKHGEMEWHMGWQGGGYFKCSDCGEFVGAVVEDNVIKAFEPSDIPGACSKCGEESLRKLQSKYGVYVRCTSCGEIQGREERSKKSQPKGKGKQPYRGRRKSRKKAS